MARMDDDPERLPERLIEKASAGDPGAIELLLERYLPTARAFVRRRMGKALRSREESLDLVQSACRRALERKDDYEHRGDRQFRAWLLEIVERKLIDRYRHVQAVRRSPEREVPLDRSAQDPLPLVSELPSPESVAVRNEATESVKLAIDRLPPELAQALELHEFENLSYERVGERMGLTPKQGRLRVLQARLELARILRDFDE